MGLCVNRNSGPVYGARIVERRYDRPETFFYLDPPYWKKPFYEHNMQWEDYQHMADVLAGLAGKFCLSINDEPDIRELFGRFQLESAKLKYSAAKLVSKPAQELLITNF